MTFVPPTTQIHKFPIVTKGGEHDFTYNIESLKVTYMFTICRVCVLRTNRKHFLHLRKGITAKHLKKILTFWRRSADWFIKRPSSYRAVNSFHLRYKNQ
jgi:hypothetical protein